MRVPSRFIDHATWITLAAVLGFAGIDKLVHYEGFVNAVNDYRVFPIPLGWMVAPLVIAAELAVAAGLCVSRWRERAAFCSVLLMILLTCGWIVNKMRGSHGLCGCWFSITLARDEWHLVLNCTLIALGLLAWWDSRASNRQALAPAQPAPLE